MVILAFVSFSYLSKRITTFRNRQSSGVPNCITFAQSLLAIRNDCWKFYQMTIPQPTWRAIPRGSSRRSKAPVFHSTKFSKFPMVNKAAHFGTSEHKDKLTRYTQTFKTFMLGIFVRCDFSRWIPLIFDWRARPSQIQKFSDFRNTFLGNFETMFHRFESWDFADNWKVQWVIFKIVGILRYHLSPNTSQVSLNLYTWANNC